MADMVAISNAAADAAKLPRLLVLACGCAESDLVPATRRPADPGQDQTYWPDVSGGAWQQTVRWDPEYHGDGSYPGPAETERILAIQYDPERSARVACANLAGKWATYGPDILATLYAYNWPHGGGKPASAAAEADYRRGLADAQKILGGSSVVTIKLSDVLARGHSRVGDTYVWGGKEPPSTDCSGFVAWCYQSQVPSFTDAIYGATQRVAAPAPGDIVLYEYVDPSQPNVRFPHVGLFISDGVTLDNRFGLGVGEHPQLARGAHTRYYRRLSGVIVDTDGSARAPAPAPVPAPIDPRDAQIAQLQAELDDARSKLGVITVDYATSLQDVVDAIRKLKPAA